MVEIICVCGVFPWVILLLEMYLCDLIKLIRFVEEMLKTKRLVSAAIKTGIVETDDSLNILPQAMVVELSFIKYF